MARKSPVRSWEARQSPRREPKFHQTEILEGAGRSTTASFAILSRGCVFRRLAINMFCCQYCKDRVPVTIMKRVPVV